MEDRMDSSTLKTEIVDSVKAALIETGQYHADEIKAAIEAHSKSDDHLYIKAMRTKEARRQEMWEKAKGNVISYLLIGVIGGTLATAWQVFKDKVS